MKIIIDTNLWISFTIGKRLTVLEAIVVHPNIQIFVSKELVDEYIDVCHRPKLQKYISESDIESTLTLMDTYCSFVEIDCLAVSNIRDVDDLFILSLADTVSAKYIVTGDADLLVLKQYNKTLIIDFRNFSDLLD